MLTYAVHGQGSALVTERLLLIADLPFDEASVLWHRVRAPEATFVSVLSAMAEGGMCQLRDFALIEISEEIPGAIVAATRGRASIEVAGQRMTGEGVTTWVETSVERVAGAILRLEDAPHDAPSLPMQRGVVQTTELVWGHEPPEHLSETAPAVRRAVPAVGEPLAEPTLIAADEQTQVRRTVPQWMLRFTSGKVVGITDRVIIGRRPTPIVDGREQLETLLSPLREVSANHALLKGLDHGVEIVDLGSKNGTAITHTTGETMLLRGGSSATLTAGDLVDFGDGNGAECVRAS